MMEGIIVQYPVVVSLLNLRIKSIGRAIAVSRRATIDIARRLIKAQRLAFTLTRLNDMSA